MATGEGAAAASTSSSKAAEESQAAEEEEEDAHGCVGSGIQVGCLGSGIQVKDGGALGRPAAVRDAPAPIRARATNRAVAAAGKVAAKPAAVRDAPAPIRARATLRALAAAGKVAARPAAVLDARRAHAPCQGLAAWLGTHIPPSGRLLFGVSGCGARRAAQRDDGLRLCRCLTPSLVPSSLPVGE